MPGSPARKQVRRPPHKAGYNPLPSQPRVGVRRGLQPGSQARRHQRLRCDQATEEVIGAVAVVQGSDTEKSTIDGKEGSGKYGSSSAKSRWTAQGRSRQSGASHAHSDALSIVHSTASNSGISTAESI